MDAPAGRGGLSVRPRPAGLYDPLTEPCPPTPRAEAFAAKAWETCCAKRHLNRWTAGQKAEARGDLVRGSRRGGESQGGSTVSATSARPAAPGGSFAFMRTAHGYRTSGDSWTILPGMLSLGSGARHFGETHPRLWGSELGLRGRTIWVTGPHDLGYGAARFGLRGRTIWVTGPHDLGYGAARFGLRIRYRHFSQLSCR